jgi:hypothetical protein
MKLQSHSRLVKTNIESETRDFGIDAEDAQGLTILLRDTLYEDKILAPIREYITNAFDATEEKFPTKVFNRPTAIHIKLPNSDMPQFSVRDFGHGLTEDEINNIYTRYGKSTKRDSNTVTGCFGIGSKSYAAYTDKATIVSRTIENKKLCVRTYIMYLDESQKAKIKKVSENIHDSWNADNFINNTGIEITWGIKLDDLNTVRSKFEALYNAWDFNKYRALVFEKCSESNDTYIGFKEVEIERIEYSVNEEDFLIVQNKDQNASYRKEKWDYRNNRYQALDSTIIMGPINYPLKTETIRNSLTDEQISFLSINGLCLKMELGSVGVTGSREGLSYNEITIAAIASKVEKCLKKYKDIILKSIAECGSWFEAYTKANDLRKSIPGDLNQAIDFVWNGMPLDWNIKLHYETPSTYKKAQCEILSINLLKNKNNEIKLKRTTTNNFSLTNRTLLLVCDYSKVSSTMASKKIKHHILKVWNEDCDLYANAAINKTSKYHNNVNYFQAFVIELNKPTEIICHYKKAQITSPDTDTKAEVLSLTKMPEWLSSMDYVNVDEIEVPKIERVKTANKESKPNKILSIDFTATGWRGAISPTPKEYDLESELCVLVTSNYSPTVRDIKDLKDVNVPGFKNIFYNKHDWYGSPQLMEQVLNKIGNPTVMPIRASELKKKNIKSLPTFTELATKWALNYLKECKSNLGILCVDLTKVLEEVKRDKTLCKLLWDETCPSMSYISDYSGFLSHNNQMDKIKLNHISELKDKRLLKLIQKLHQVWKGTHTVQSNKTVELAMGVLFAVNCHHEEKNPNSGFTVKTHFVNRERCMQNLNKLFKFKEDKRLITIINNLSDHITNKHPITRLIKCESDRRYGYPIKSWDYLKEKFKHNGETFRTEKSLEAKLELLIKIFNKEYK